MAGLFTTGSDRTGQDAPRSPISKGIGAGPSLPFPGFIGGREHELDLLDSQIAAERRIQVAQTRDLLPDLGFDVSGYTLPPYPHRLQRRCRDHPDGSEQEVRIAMLGAARGRDPRRLNHYVGGTFTKVKQ